MQEAREAEGTSKLFKDLCSLKEALILIIA
jgi:hypothetical protein